MATARILLGFVCFALVGGQHLPERDVLKRTALEIALAELGVRETRGNNDGPQIRAYLAAAGLHKPAPWCAAFISWCYSRSGAPAPRTVWSPALFPAARLRPHPERGQVFGIYFPELGRIGHCGFVERLQGDWIITVEGNTNLAGSREGDGVYRKWRPRRSIHRFADWNLDQKKTAL